MLCVCVCRGMLTIHDAGAGYFENMWAWVADHDSEYALSDPCFAWLRCPRANALARCAVPSAAVIARYHACEPARRLLSNYEYVFAVDTGGSLTVVSPRGVTITSTGPTVLMGTAAEHSANYQYNISGASSVTTVITQVSPLARVSTSFQCLRVMWPRYGKMPQFLRCWCCGPACCLRWLSICIARSGASSALRWRSTGAYLSVVADGDGLLAGTSNWLGHDNLGVY